PGLDLSLHLGVVSHILPVLLGYVRFDDPRSVLFPDLRLRHRDLVVGGGEYRLRYWHDSFQVFGDHLVVSRFHALLLLLEQTAVVLDDSSLTVEGQDRWMTMIQNASHVQRINREAN